MSFIVILSTAPTQKESRKLANALLKQKLAACINIIPGAESHYTWKGKQERSKEYLLVIKTKKSLFSKVSKAIKAIHSYDVPEIIALPITSGHPDYLGWLRSQMKH